MGRTGPSLLARPPNISPSDWLEDGTILGTTQDLDIVAARVDGAGVQPVLEADWEERTPMVSPDGRWLAYKSNESDTLAVYVRAWPDLGQRMRVSIGPGGVSTQGRLAWSPDGRTLYYAQDDGIVAATVDGTGPFRVLSRRPIPVEGEFFLADMHADGRLLLAMREADTSAPPRLVLITNWSTALRSRLTGPN